MKTMNSIATDDNKTNLSLHKLIDDLISPFSTDPAYSHNHIVNNVARNLNVNANEESVVAVIKAMLHAMITNAADGDIHISAKEFFGNTIKLSVRDNNSYNTYAIACGLQNIVPLAEHIGGYLGMMNQRQKITTVEFSFPLVKEDDQSGMMNE